MRTILALVFLAFTSPVFAQAAKPAERAKPTGDTAEFILSVGIANIYELDAARIALERSKNPDVKLFANKIVADHTAMGNALKVAASSLNTTVPPTDDAAHTALLKDLRAKDAGQFDKTYMAQQIDAHQKAVATLKAYAADGQNGDLKKFAAENVGHLQAHLDDAQALQHKL